jgi:hypothetical protein
VVVRGIYFSIGPYAAIREKYNLETLKNYVIVQKIAFDTMMSGFLLLFDHEVCDEPNAHHSYPQRRDPVLEIDGLPNKL